MIVENVTDPTTELLAWQLEPAVLSAFNNQGFISFGDTISIGKPSVQNIDQILGLLNGEAALVPVQASEIVQTTLADLNFIACDSQNGAVIGYQSIGLWDKLQLLELRSAKVLPEYRGKGLNTVMKKVAISVGMQKFPGWKFIGFTEAESKSRGILHKLGFQEVSLQEAVAQWYELSSICPSACFIKTGHACGCKVYILNPYEAKQ